MKKFFWTACLAASPLAMAQNVQPEQMVGKWLCTVSYPQTSDVTNVVNDYRADGTSSSQGEMVFADVQGHELRYKIDNKGTWRLEGGNLIERLVSEKTFRNHKPATQTLLQQSPDLRQAEENIFKIFSTPTEDEIKLEIIDFSRQQFKVLHETGVNGICTRMP